jgi:hypothetical protein
MSFRILQHSFQGLPASRYQYRECALPQRGRGEKTIKPGAQECARRAS